MPLAKVSVVGTDADANRAVRVLSYPEFETLLGPGRPFQDALQIRHTVGLARRFTGRNRFRRTG